MLHKPQYKHYLSILILTKTFQDKENGLQQKHYRYALQKGVKKENFKMQKFFSNCKGINLLESLYEDRMISKDCLKPDKEDKKIGKLKRNNTLSNFLRLLADRGWLDITNPGEKNKKYTIPDTFGYEFDKINYAKIITDFPPTEMRGIIAEGFSSIKSKKYDISFDSMFFGIPEIMFDEMKKEDREKLENAFVNIHENIFKVIQLKKEFYKKKDVPEANRLHFFCSSKLRPKDNKNIPKEGLSDDDKCLHRKYALLIKNVKPQEPITIDLKKINEKRRGEINEQRRNKV